MKPQDVFRDLPPQAHWYRILTGGFLAAWFFSAAFLAWGWFEGGYFSGGLVLFFALGLAYGVIWGQTPRRYEISPKGMLIVLNGPFKFFIGFDNLQRISEGGWEDALAGAGLRFISSHENVLRVERKKGWDVIITPGDAGLFKAKLEQAREKWGQN
ncbi:hypothetical protein [Dethiosulfatarculus sandiegensis]|uniref:PH domain-containing protein n=1 Tax=Dethiosulfatarculus sandiegensis TaxID=1429043 RepID=A0A0D2JDU9_9BACT|nr:hypothetical protein [Dethiosulfatarculus sandiegensis]KIX13846.1 hypothetical protein X474_11250 [Dethiosulfatarculus sandiegensis]